jgi:hypothetical protein
MKSSKGFGIRYNWDLPQRGAILVESLLRCDNIMISYSSIAADLC